MQNEYRLFGKPCLVRIGKNEHKQGKIVRRIKTNFGKFVYDITIQGFGEFPQDTFRYPENNVEFLTE